MSADLLDVANYIEWEAGQLIRQARTEREKAWSEVARLNTEARAKDKTIRDLTRLLQAQKAQTTKARNERDRLRARHDRLLARYRKAT